MEGILTTRNYKSFVVQTQTGDELAQFEGASSVPKGMPGDTVRFNTKQQKWDVIQRPKYPFLVGILELASKTKYGMTSRGVPKYLFTPCHKQFPMMIVGCSHKDTSTHQLALVQFTEWTTTSLPCGQLIRLLGPCGNPDAEQEALYLTYNPFKLPKDIGLSVPKDDTLRDRQPREKTPPMTFNIDPLGCKDIDDVLSIEVDYETKTVNLWITIADVAEYVPANSTLDGLAFQQCATSYVNGEAVRPMLPKEYSEGHCTLLPNTERLGVSLILTYRMDVYEEPIHQRWTLSLVNNAYQFDYDTFLEKAIQSEIPISILHRIASNLRKEITYDPHKWIEAFMLKYNLEVATILRKQQSGVLRKHAITDLETLARYQLWGGEALAMLANRSAVYCHATDPAPLHWGLQANLYCHATSPIRRYADLVNQRVLKCYLLKETIPALNLNIPWLNQRQKDLKQFERDTFLTSLLLTSKSGACKALLLDWNPCMDGNYKVKYKLWIPQWKRVLTWKTATPLPKEVEPSVWINLRWFANPAKRFWKDSLVFQYDGVCDPRIVVDQYFSQNKKTVIQS